MPIIALTRPVALEIPQLRRLLVKALPHWTWRCGDDDTGAPHDRASFDRPQTILGRSGDAMVMTSIEAHDRPLPPDDDAPAHRLHLTFSPPTTDDADLARTIAVICCASLMVHQDEQAHCQIDQQGPWQSTADMRAELARWTADESDGKSIDDVVSRAEIQAPLGTDSASSAPPTLDEAADVFASIRDAAPRRIGGFGRKGL